MASVLLMPGKPSYCRDLPRAIDLLRATDSVWVDRRELETALSISKSAAWRLLRQLGCAESVGGALLCRREELIARLEDLRRSNGVAAWEVRRRERFTAYMEQIRPQAIANHTKIAPREKTLDLVNTRFGSLPPNVSLTPTSLHIDFHGTEDLLAAFGALVFALNNDYEAISAFVEAKDQSVVD